MTPLIALSTLSLLGYHLTFDAEMSSPSDMSQFINTFSNGDTRLYNNHEEENYVPYNPNDPANPFAFLNGALSITAFPTPVNGEPYTSGMMETSGIFSQSTGYFEIRASTPGAQGFWYGFWMLPFGGFYPEIDILEQPNNSGTTTEYWTHTSTPTDNSGGFSDTGVNITSGYHTYGFLWTANTIQYVFDGQLVGWPHVEPPSMAGLQMYLIVQNAVGDQYSWPGAPIPGAWSTLGVDYVRAYSTDPTVPTVSQEPISSPDGVNTLPVLLPPTPSTPLAIGTGPDTLVLKISEDAYQGDAQFTVSVDGKQRGKIQTAQASHAFGQVQQFQINGNFGHSRHTVTVDFLNDYSDSGGDRNLYVNGASIDGEVIGSSALNESASGPQSFSFWNAPIKPIAIGSGPDVFQLSLSGDHGSYNPHFTVSVDGVQQGTANVISALHQYGQTQQVTVAGNFGSGSHSVVVSFPNGVVSGQPASGVNLYVDSLSYKGIAVPDSAVELSYRGSLTYVTPVEQPDTVVLNMTEDAWVGDAQTSVFVDGVSVGQATVTAPKGSSPQQLTFSGEFGGAAAAHTVTVEFLNDLYNGPGQDRNLYLTGMTFDGTSISSGQSLMRNGPVIFNYVPPASTPPLVTFY